MVIALDGRERWHLLFAYDPDRESVEDYPPERCEAIVRELMGSDDVEIDVRSVLPWRMRKPEPVQLPRTTSSNTPPREGSSDGDVVLCSLCPHGFRDQPAALSYFVCLRDRGCYHRVDQRTD